MTTRTQEPLGVYVHVPFCEQKCAYCDFFTITDPGRTHPLHDRWLDLCLAEMRLWIKNHPALAGREIGSIFFGGGTPSLLRPGQFEQFIGAMQREFGFAPRVEISLETQPATIAPEDYRAMVAAGINRFSVGVQTFNPRLLAPTERRHTVEDSEETLHYARATTAALSLDMICALPGQTPDEWRADLERTLSFSPDHMSVYEMTYHPGTDYHRQLKRGHIRQPDDQLMAEMFRHTRSRLTGAGYHHYEISNYAKPGFESIHNRIYWTLGDFVGLGAGAHSYVGGHRYANPRSADAYAKTIDKSQLFAQLQDSPDPDITLVENLQMVLRLTAGADLDWLTERLGQDIRETRQRQLETVLQRGWLAIENNRLCLTDEGQLYADSVTEAFL